MKFTKMHGIGNDYVYIDTFEQDEPKIGWTEVAKRVSDRRFGVGGDGLILIEKGISENAQGRMRMFNSDGSESEMCGNGLRCVAKYLYDNKYKGSDKLNLDTGAGLLVADIKGLNNEGEAEKIEINMGKPILTANEIPSTGTGLGAEEALEVDGMKLQYTAVSMGNPHCVIFVDDTKAFPVEKIGPLIENNTALFPNRINVEFIQIISRNEAIQRTWERGSGETLACGTGASAVAVAGQLRGKFDSEVLIHLTGGDLKITWKGDGENVFMEGGATYVCEGILNKSLYE
jgi:diaminopimelate epimerase